MSDTFEILALKRRIKDLEDYNDDLEERLGDLEEMTSDINSRQTFLDQSKKD